MKNKRLENFLFFSIAIGIVLSLTGVFLDYFPNSKGLFSHDYAFLSYNFDSAIWVKKNGWFSIPWFSPSFCGGLPKFADPQNNHYSIHNLLIYYFSPISGTILMFLFTAILSLTFCYRFFFKVLKSDKWVSLLGGSIFLLNSFFISRMIIGHTPFVSFMSIFMILYFIFAIKDSILSILSIAFTIASFVYGGSVFIVITCFYVCAIVSIYLDITKTFPFKSSALRVFSGFTLAGIFSCMKLYATHSYYSKFSKDFYALPGLNSLLKAFVYPLKLLMFTPPDSTNIADWTNMQWTMERHELEYMVGITPFIIILICTIMIFRKNSFSFRKPSTSSFLKITVLSFLLFVPIILNYYNEDLNNLYKKLPVINQLVAPMRWYSVYIPLSIIFAIHLLNQAPDFFKKLPFISVLILLTIGQFHLTDRAFYDSENFNADHILRAFSSLDQTGDTRKISNIIVPDIYKNNDDLTAISMLNPNEPFLYGYSSTRCYAPIFGYKLEVLPKMTLVTGSVLSQRDGYLNINDPRCYLFPKQNFCIPGDKFKVVDKGVVEKFINFKEIPFEMPRTQNAAVYISLISIILGISIAAIRLFSISRKN